MLNLAGHVLVNFSKTWKLEQTDYFLQNNLQKYLMFKFLFPGTKVFKMTAYFIAKNLFWQHFLLIPVVTPIIRKVLQIEMNICLSEKCKNMPKYQRRCCRVNKLNRYIIIAQFDKYHVVIIVRHSDTRFKCSLADAPVHWP